MRVPFKPGQKIKWGGKGSPYGLLRAVVVEDNGGATFKVHLPDSESSVTTWIYDTFGYKCEPDEPKNFLKIP